jgi:4-amino-4-deoxy-L-arabinose transferase-like glycosyltransferase
MNIRLLGFLIVLTVLRLVYIGQVGLVPDEAYYHEWSQRLDWWYFSKGPGVALAMRASTALFGHNEFGVRFFAPLLGLGTTLLIYWLARRLYDERVAFWTAIIVSVTPIFNAGALLMTIDAPSIFFWTAALCTLWLALEKSPAFSGWWALSGVLIGIGWLFKMTNALLLLCVALLLVLTPRRRRELLRPGFWSMLLAAFPFALPMFHWNSARGWPTTSHLAARGGLDTPWWHLEWKSFLEFIGMHFGVYSPLIFFAMVAALAVTVWPSFERWGSAFRRSIAAVRESVRAFWLGWVMVFVVAAAFWLAGNFSELPALHSAAKWWLVLVAILFVAVRKEAANMHWKSRFLAAFALPLLLGYLWVALHHKAEPNWTAPASVSMVVLAVACWRERITASLGWRVLTGAALLIGASVSLVAVETNILRAVGFPLSFKRDPTGRLRGWREAALRVNEFRQSLEKQSGQKFFLIANSYGTAAALGFYLPEKRIEAPGHPAVYVPESPVAENQFHFWGRYDEYEERKQQVVNDQEDSKEYGVNRFAGRTALYITDREWETIMPPEIITRTFERWELKTVFRFFEFGLPLREVSVFVCYRYKSGVLLD